MLFRRGRNSIQFWPFFEWNELQGNNKSSRIQISNIFETQSKYENTQQQKYEMKRQQSQLIILWNGKRPSGKQKQNREKKIKVWILNQLNSFWNISND